MDAKKHNLVAIDIAKNELEVLSCGRRLKFSNDTAGLRTLVGHLRALPTPWVFCEATGGYERELMGALHHNRITVTLINPARVRAFARSEGVKAKSDPIDTEMIERFAQQKKLLPTPPPPRPELTALMDRRRHLTDELAREKTRLKNSLKTLHLSIRRCIAFLKRELEKINRQIRAQISQDSVSERAASVMQEVEGVGEVTAWSILAYLPEITTLSRNQIVSLVGLAPFDRDSGSHKGHRHIFGGRHKVRHILYMATEVASHHNPVIKAYLDRLLARGKPRKCAIVAAMRKLLIHLQSLLKKHQICLVS